MQPALAALAGLSELPSRMAHVTGVAAVAAEIADRLDLTQSELLIAAAWLHDIGYAESLAATGFHPVDGATWAREASFPETVVSLVAHHTGAAIEAEERGMQDALADFERPDSLLLDMLTFADLSVGPGGDPVIAEDRIAEILDRYPVDHPVHRAVIRSTPELLGAAERIRRLLSAAES